MRMGAVSNKVLIQCINSLPVKDRFGSEVESHVRTAVAKIQQDQSLAFSEQSDLKLKSLFWALAGTADANVWQKLSRLDPVDAAFASVFRRWHQWDLDQLSNGKRHPIAPFQCDVPDRSFGSTVTEEEFYSIAKLLVWLSEEDDTRWVCLDKTEKPDFLIGRLVDGQIIDQTGVEVTQAAEKGEQHRLKIESWFWSQVEDKLKNIDMALSIHNWNHVIKLLTNVTSNEREHFLDTFVSAVNDNASDTSKMVRSICNLSIGENQASISVRPMNDTQTAGFSLLPMSGKRPRLNIWVQEVLTAVSHKEDFLPDPFHTNLPLWLLIQTLDDWFHRSEKFEDGVAKIRDMVKTTDIGNRFNRVYLGVPNTKPSIIRVYD